MPGARCTRGLVCKMHKEMRTRAYRFSGGSPAFPAQWLYGLCRALLGDEFFFVTVASGLRLCPSPVGPTRLRELSISNGCQDHTVLPYADSVARPARRTSLTSFARPAITLRADAAASTASPPAFRDDREAPLLPGKDGTSW
jgi:hypothetical protein